MLRIRSTALGDRIPLTCWQPRYAIITGMDAKTVFAIAALFGVSGGIVWANLPPVLTMSAEERQAIEASVHYTGCNEVRALGKAPIRAGEPGYRIEMDGDGDGVACEPRQSDFRAGTMRMRVH